MGTDEVASSNDTNMKEKAEAIGSSPKEQKNITPNEKNEVADEKANNGIESKKEGAEDEKAKKKREDELKKKYADWPLRGIKEPHENDVMYGRGGGTNHHPGNKRYRKMVEDRKLEYVNSKRLDKPLVALEIIRIWRAQLPPGRFLKLDEKSGLWHDVGDKKAREKTSQALREKAPLIRKQQEEGKDDNDEDGKTTRFAEGTKKEDANQVRKAVLARDHSLGREYIEAGEAVTLDGFSWQDPFQSRQRQTSYGRSTAGQAAYPAGRNSSHGSLGMTPPHHTSVGAPPPPPDYWGRVNSGGTAQREFSNSRIESWGAGSYGYPPPPPPPAHAMHQRSGSWTNGPPPPGRMTHQRSGSWGSGREHSLGMFPLVGASVTDPANRGTFDSGRSASGFGWGDGSPPRGAVPPPPQQAGYGGSAGPVRSGGSLGPYRQPISPATSTPSPKPPYSVDMNIAKTWSGGEVQRTWSGEQQPSIQTINAFEGQARQIFGGDGNPNMLPRPQIVKRDTSHQNENYETKPQVKRAALNRDNSLASNRLKQEYMPEYFNSNPSNRKFDAEQEVQRLSTNLEQSTIDTERPKPIPVSDQGRVSTIDAITMDLMAKPAVLLKDDRMNTIDVLDLDLDEDVAVKPQQEPPALAKPQSLEPDDRLTTNDFIDLVNSPMPADPLPPKVDGGNLNQEKIADEWLTQV